MTLMKKVTDVLLVVVSVAAVAVIVADIVMIVEAVIAVEADVMELDRKDVQTSHKTSHKISLRTGEVL
jgi:hypothetical protein